MSGLFLNESRLVGGVRGLLGNVRSMLTSEPDLVSVTTPSFGCSRGYHLDSEGDGCGESGSVRSVLVLYSLLTDWFSVSVSVFTVVCPAGSFSREGVCLLCPQGTYQDEEGRDFCNQCPRGSSPAGASSVNQCESV